MDVPYKEYGELRTFSSLIKDDELVWHRDREDRILSPNHTTDWQFQFDNELPILINKEIFIPKGTYHRIIKGKGDLTVKIIKLENNETI